MDAGFDMASTREDTLHDLRVQMIREELVEALSAKSPGELRQRQLALEHRWAQFLPLLGRLAVDVANEYKALLLAPKGVTQ